MAGLLSISDGTVTVNLYDTAGLHLARDGWSPRQAVESLSGDTYDDVVEVIRCEWSQVSDDTRDTTMHNINYLAAKARDTARRRLLTDQVYVSARTPSETNTRYAVVKDITVNELDSRHWGPNQPVQLSIIITREGAWRKDVPMTYSEVYPSVATGTVYNQVSGAYVNYLDIPAASITGDALALPIIKATAMTAQQDSVTVALRSDLELTHITSFNPHFNAAAFGRTTRIVADASAPGGQAWHPVSTDKDNYVALPAGLTRYDGTFLVYAVARADAASMSLAVGHSTATSFGINANSSVSVPITTNYMPVYLGRITMPPSGVIPGIAVPTAYYINLRAGIGGPGTLKIRNIYLIPINDGVIQLEQPLQDWFIDSVLEHSWNIPPSFNRYTDTPAVPRGRYLKLKPGYNHRLMFFYHQTDAAGGVDASHTAAITVRVGLRYLSLRGNT